MTGFYIFKSPDIIKNALISQSTINKRVDVKYKPYKNKDGDAQWIRFCYQE